MDVSGGRSGVAGVSVGAGGSSGAGVGVGVGVVAGLEVEGLEVVGLDAVEGVVTPAPQGPESAGL